MLLIELATLLYIPPACISLIKISYVKVRNLLKSAIFIMSRGNEIFKKEDYAILAFQGETKAHELLLFVLPLIEEKLSTSV